MARNQIWRSSSALRAAVALLLAFTNLAVLAPVASAALPTAPGTACLFNAPYAVFPYAQIGHIGWAYKSGSGDTWVFGATEGNGSAIVTGNASATHSWILTGTWANVLSTFGKGDSPYPVGPGYYMSYRCSSPSSTHPTQAYNTAYTESNSGYNLANNNCLTKAVKILRAYGATDLVSPTWSQPPTNFPDAYFESKLPSSFAAARSLTVLTVSVKLLDPPLYTSYINTAPVHRTRPLTVEVLDASGATLTQQTVNATVVPGTGMYTASLLLDRTRSWSAAGLATVTQVRVRLDYTLRKFVSGITLINAGVDNVLPPASLVVGDVNQDNVVNLTDYNLIMQCYSDLLPPKGPCDPATTIKRATDLNDDGAVNQIDYNLYLRVVQNPSGN